MIAVNIEQYGDIRRRFYILQLVAAEFVYNDGIGFDIRHIGEYGNTDVAHKPCSSSAFFQNMIYQRRCCRFAFCARYADNRRGTESEKQIGLRCYFVFDFFAVIFEYRYSGRFHYYVVPAEVVHIMLSEYRFALKRFKRNAAARRNGRQFLLFCVRNGDFSRRNFVFQKFVSRSALSAEAENKHLFVFEKVCQFFFHFNSSFSSFGTLLFSSKNVSTEVMSKFLS